MREWHGLEHTLCYYFHYYFLPFLRWAFPLLSWAPLCKAGNELLSETSLPSLSSAGDLYRRHECPRQEDTGGSAKGITEPGVLETHSHSRLPCFLH